MKNHRDSGMRKRSDAFTIAEILIALFVLASSMSVLADLQVKSMFRVQRGRDEIERMPLIKEQLYRLFARPEPPSKKEQLITVKEPKTVIKMGMNDIDKKSSLFAQFKNDISVIWAEGSWKRGNRDATMKMISFVTKPPEKQEQ